MPSLTKKQCIAENLKICKFVVSENLKVNGAEPIYEISAFSEVNRYSSIIENVAAESGVDVRLIRSIMYMETTHGYYDAPLSLLGQNKSILPMNVNVDYWGSIFGDRKTLLNPYTAFSTSKSYLIVGMLVQVILLILVLTEYPFFSYFFKDENADTLLSRYMYVYIY